MKGNTPTDTHGTTLVSRYRELWASPQWASRPALMDAERVITYAELRESVAQRAGRLRQVGIGDGERVALALNRSVDAALTILAVMVAGACPCPLEPRLNAKEIGSRLATAGIGTVLFDADHAQVIQQVEASGPNTIGLEAASKIRLLRIDTLPDAQPYWHPQLSDDAPGLLLFTSGSTGRPKGVLISHKGMLNNALGVQSITQLSPDDRLLHMMPLYHTNGLNNQLFTPLLVGAQVALTERFRAEHVPGWMSRFRPTIITGVPTMYSRLLAQTFPAEALASLRFARCGSAPITTELHRKIEAHLGCPLVISYGLSEATCTSTMNPPEAPKVGSIGKALPLQKVYLRDAQGREVTEPYKDGEICIEGDSLMLGYLGVEEDGVLSTPSPVLETGDLGHVDEEGYFFITGRLKDVIIRGGENIAPGIIEKVIDALPDVQACCVVGQSHHDLGEVPVAFVVPAPGLSLSASTVKQQVAESLSRIYWLEDVYIVDALPENAVGKVDKKKLKEQLAAMVA